MNHIQHESEIVEKMIRLHCKLVHQPQNKICIDCNNLLEYSKKKLDNCRFGNNKPNCENCKTHCYQKDYREKIKNVMRFSGPRMLFYHPFDVLYHILHKKKRL